MAKYDFSKPLIDNAGKETDKQTLADVLSESLGTLTEGKTAKLYGWHKKLKKDGFLELDEADRKDLVNLIEVDKRLYIFVKGQLQEVLEKAAD